MEKQKVKKIDLHVHSILKKGIERLSGGTYTTPEELRVIYDKLGIDKGVQLPAVSPECRHYILTNEESLELTKQNPDLYYWFCNIDPRWGNNTPNVDLSHFINYFKALGAKGVGEIMTNLPFDDPRMQNLFMHCEKCEMPILFHMGVKVGGCYGIVDELGLPGLENSLAAFPGLQFIGHSQVFWSQISSDVTEDTRSGYPTGKVIPGRIVELMRKYPNLTADLSAHSGYNAVSRDPEFGYQFIEEFQDRLYFATDICDPRNEMKLSFWLDDAYESDGITSEAYVKVCRNNALKLLER